MQSSGDITLAILAGAQADNFAGYDPFDGLNSRFFDLLPGLKRGAFGLAWIQLLKRSPINLRPLLGVPKRRNPKGIGLFILGLLEDYERTHDLSLIKQAIELADWLLTEQCDQAEWQHSCWGYHFDWMARAFFVPKGKPNVITTVYVAQALFKLSQVLNAKGKDSNEVEKYRIPAFDAAAFIVNTLYTESEGRCFFAYIPGETAFVHNASLWAAAWVSVVAAEIDDPECREKYRQLALTVARQSVSEQGSDGSWIYGARHHHQFIDGFHTGYILESLDLICCSLNVSEFDAAIEKGLVYYKSNFFEKDGKAKYYHNKSYPLDMHSVAQAVMTLIKVGGTEADLALANKVLQHSIESLYQPTKKSFVYQRNKFYTNRINYTRWTQAWVYYSFAFFNRYISSQNK
jgi:hypothetical protein